MSITNQERALQPPSMIGQDSTMICVRNTSDTTNIGTSYAIISDQLASGYFNVHGAATLGVHLSMVNLGGGTTITIQPEFYDDQKIISASLACGDQASGVITLEAMGYAVSALDAYAFTIPVPPSTWCTLRAKAVATTSAESFYIGIIRSPLTVQMRGGLQT